MRGRRKQCDTFWGFRRDLPAENVNIKQVLLYVLILSFFYHLRQSVRFEVRHFLAQQDVDQIHFMEIPEVLVVKTSYGFVFMLELACDASFTVSCNAKNEIKFTQYALTQCLCNEN